MEKEHFGERLSKLIDALGITQSAFAARLGISQPYVSKLLKGGIPSNPQIDNICSKFKVRREWLLDGTGGDENMFVESAQREKAYERFAYIMENAAPAKKAALSALLDLLYVVPDDVWDDIIKKIDNAVIASGGNSLFKAHHEPTIDEKVEAYRRELELEKEVMEKFGA